MRAEQHQAAVGEHQRDAEREDDLRVVPLGLGRDDARAGDLRDQVLMQQPADRVDDGARKQRPDDRADIGAEDGERSETGDQVERDVHAEHHEVAVGEVHDAHHAEDDAEADAHQAVGAADQQARRHRLKKVDQQPLERFHGPSPERPTRSARGFGVSLGISVVGGEVRR